MGLLTDIVAYYKLDESSGNASDSVGSNDLTNTDVTYVSGKINNCASFNGTTSKLVKANTSDLQLIGDFTFSFWVNLDTFADGSVRLIFDKFGTGSQRSYLIRLHNDGGTHKLILNISSNGSTSTQTSIATSTLTTGTWYHIVVLFDVSAGIVDMYVNNTAKTQGTGHNTSIFDGSEPFSVGGSTNGYLDGKLDEIAVYDRLLTSTEVSTLYNNGDGKQYPFTVTTFTPKMMMF